MTPPPCQIVASRGYAPIVSALLAAALLMAAGCTREPPSSHGDILGDSLNGVSAFVGLLRDRGHGVSAASSVSESALAERDAAIVFVDGPGPIDDVAAGHLESFLARPGSQWILLVGRDGDWAVDYWRFVAGREDLTDIQRQRAGDNLERAKESLAAWYRDLPASTVIARFSAADLIVRAEGSDGGEINVTIRSGGDEEGITLPGHWTWRRGVDPGAADGVEWEVDGAALLVRSIDDSSGDTILVLGSDMPLLNAGLVDGGNRQIAAALVDLVPVGAEVALFGSAQGRAGSRDDEETAAAWRLVTVPPHPWIAAHLLLGLLLFCWSRAPIFGRARVRPAAAVRDFGHHVDALGRLLAKGKDTATSAALLAEWERVGRPGPGHGGGDRPEKGKLDIQPEARKR